MAENVKAKYKAVSGRLSNHFGFKLSEDESVSSAEKIYCMTCEKSFAYHGSNTALLYHLQRAHPLQYKQLLDKKSSKKSPVPSSSGQISQFSGEMSVLSVIKYNVISAILWHSGLQQLVDPYLLWKMQVYNKHCALPFRTTVIHYQ